MSERLHCAPTLLCRNDCIIGQVAARYSQLGSLGVDRRDYFDRVGALRPLIMQSKWVDKNHFFVYFFLGTTASSGCMVVLLET